MTDFDSKISAALSAEDELLLKEMGNEPGYFEQVFGMFRGSMGWISGILMIAQTIMFFVSIWMALHFFRAEDSVAQLRWGLPAATLMILSAMMKFSLMPVLQSNRILREMRRIELLRNR
ncbi:MAG: DUF6768 family protein [Sphingorhabdus sp.]